MKIWFCILSNRKFTLPVYFFLVSLTAFSQPADYAARANPFIGTGGHGHTYPGASMPFGMMQMSPDTRLDGWDGCSGYHYSDTVIYGFSHTHLSGTGISDYGDILLMPTNKVIFTNGSDGKNGYRTKFSHDTEVAEPGYYKVKLESTNIEVELTVSKRSGIQKYQFPSLILGSNLKSSVSFNLIFLKSGCCGLRR